MEAQKVQKELNEIKKDIEKTKQEMSKIVIGQIDIIDGLFRALLANGHVLVEGVPGVAKTLIIRTLGAVTGCQVGRIQFTVDLLPTDIVGITTYHEKLGFQVEKGPIFANFVIADEINRAPPKTQSALLEAMQEKQSTIGKQTFKLPLPFFVMATQNPLENQGTYPLPEAQVDRFLFKIIVGYPNKEEEQLILSTNMTTSQFDDYQLKPMIDAKKILKMQEFVKKVYVSEEVKKYIVEIIDATRNPKDYGIKLGKYIEFGGSPRASIGLFIAAKAEAVIEGKAFVTPQHVKKIAKEVLRHRFIVNYEGQAENIKTDDIITEILSKVKVP